MGQAPSLVMIEASSQMYTKLIQEFPGLTVMFDYKIRITSPTWGPYGISLIVPEDCLCNHEAQEIGDIFYEIALTKSNSLHYDATLLYEDVRRFIGMVDVVDEIKRLDDAFMEMNNNINSEM